MTVKVAAPDLGIAEADCVAVCLLLRDARAGFELPPGRSPFLERENARLALLPARVVGQVFDGPFVRLILVGLCRSNRRADSPVILAM